MTSNLSIRRRDLARLAVALGVATPAFAAFGPQAAKAERRVVTPRRGMVSVHPLGAITLHTYIAPSDGAVVTTQIVETETALHVLDTQFLQPFAIEARAYADSLGKPIAKVMLSHWHPDHLLGVSQYADVPFVTTEAVRNDCETFREIYGARKEAFGDATPLRLPETGLTTGRFDWDGAAVEIGQIADTEVEHHLTFYFPDAGLMIAQDLMYHDVHAYPAAKSRQKWIAALREIQGRDGLRLIGCGHGHPASVAAVQDAIAYLAFQGAVFDEQPDAEAATKALLEAYPHYDGEILLQFTSLVYQDR